LCEALEFLACHASISLTVPRAAIFQRRASKF
jgi:hypothetical protein